MDGMKTFSRVALIAVVVASFVACGGGDGGSDTAGSGEEECSHEVTTTSDGLKIEDIECGEGAEAKKGDSLTVHYVGKLADGTKFDASRDHGQPFQFQLGAGQVIAGWDEGLVGMKVGGKRQLTIPPELGYGKSGSPPVIPPNATLVFEIELLEIN